MELHALAGAAYPTWCAWCFSLAFLSAVCPWFSAELVVLAIPALTSSPRGMLGLVVVATVGQMVGKCIVFAAGRRGTRVHYARVRTAVARWRDRVDRSQGRAAAWVFLSASVGFPPFFAVSALAGAASMRFGQFVIAGTAGRLLRFTLIAWLPNLLVHAAQP